MSPLLKVSGLTTSFPVGKADIPVVDEVSFSIEGGEVLALVGESGCGKSMTALSIMRLVFPAMSPNPEKYPSDVPSGVKIQAPWVSPCRSFIKGRINFDSRVSRSSTFW